MARMVQCAKLGMELPGLDAPPFPGSLGRRIYEEISAEAWAMWREAQTIMINHYALNPADPDDRKVLREQMEEFLFGDGGDMPSGWAPAGAGEMSKGGAPARKK